jgi:hypothetical protein
MCNVETPNLGDAQFGRLYSNYLYRGDKIMYQQFFSFGNFWVMPFWFLMIFCPWWSQSEKLMRGLVGWIGILVPAVLYIVSIAPQIGGLGFILSPPQLDSVARLLGSPEGATIGWLHFLSFDLFVGRWIFLDSRERGISAWLISPSLFFTLMLGPIGLMAYIIIRTIIPNTNTPPINKE